MIPNDATHVKHTGNTVPLGGNVLPPYHDGTNAHRSARASLPEAVTKPESFRFTPLSTVLTWPEPVYLIHKLLVVGGTSLLTARHASFKSFIALDMGLCVATGNLWHGYETKGGTVIYIAAEGASGLKKTRSCMA